MEKMQIALATLLAIMLAFTLLISANAETYPVYEVITRPALLRKNPMLSEVPLEQDENIICSVSIHSYVLVAEETDGWCLIYTQDEQVGYMQSDDLKETGSQHSIDADITAEKIAHDQSDIQYISIDQKAILPDESEYFQEYPVSVSRSAVAFDSEVLLEALLGSGYETVAHEETSRCTKYESCNEAKRYRYVSIEVDTGELDYYDAMITGERQGEYQAPKMNMPYDESLVLCKSLLLEYIDNSRLEYPNLNLKIGERWNSAGNWMTDSQYDEYIRSLTTHTFTFEHRTEDGISILDDGMTASIGVNGLDTLIVNWHDFTTNEASTLPLTLDDAISLANSTRKSPAVLLYAQLVYSNRLTESKEYNLSWYLVTSEGNYVVDCISEKHVCDSYEY